MPRAIDEILAIKGKAAEDRSIVTSCVTQAFLNLMCDARAAAEDNQVGVTSQIAYIGRGGQYENLIDQVMDRLIQKCKHEGFKEAFRSKTGQRDHIWIRWSDNE